MAEKPQEKSVLTTPKTVVVPPKAPEPSKDAPKAVLETKPKAALPPEPPGEAKLGTHPDPLPKVGPSEGVQPLAGPPVIPPGSLENFEKVIRIIVEPLPSPKQDEFDRAWRKFKEDMSPKP